MEESVEKTVTKIRLDPEKWTRTKASDGTVTYEATEPATVRFTEPDGTIQEHTGVPAGKKFESKNGHVDLWGLY